MHGETIKNSTKSFIYLQVLLLLLLLAKQG